ncbi:hypothetical protein DL96DRAFT_1148477 [Flagelloscypha sp. PMI_526]|nr:hypothetical protein DL96DRAFT_1148477 [Flagelloscypha sp. PMI_526]
MTGPVRNGEEGSGAGSSGTKAPRPPNSWIIYRSDKMREMTQPRQKAGGKGMTQADLSRVIANMWKTETDAVRGEYERRAEIKKAEHYARFPNYRFQPVKKEERVQQKKAAVALKAANAAEETTRRRVKPSSGLRTPPVSAASRSRVASASSRAQPQVEQYGPCGPSPPISAASTPEFLPFDSPPRQPSPIDMPPSAYPPIPLSPNFQQHQQHTAADTILRPMTPPEDIINFNIPEMAAGLNYGLHDLHNWNFQPDPSLIEQTESLQYDIQSQQLVNLDGTPLTSAPPGGFELQMGQFPGPRI